MIGELYTAMCNATWAIKHEALTHICGAIRGENLTEARTARKLPRVQGGIVTLPIHGVISQRWSIWNEFFGGTDTEGLGAAYSAAINSSKVGAVILSVDSPGGTINGVPELADLIRRGSQVKPVAAIADTQAASAAYWLASQVGGGKKALTAAPSAEVGSIGVFRVHEDLSEMLAEDGIKVTFIAVPEFKTEANPYEPLSQAAMTHHLGQVEAAYEMFVQDVARGRGVNKSTVKDAYGRGRMFHAAQAAEMGLVDRVAPFEQLTREFGAESLSSAEAQTLHEEMCHAWETGAWQPIVDPDNLRRRDRMQALLDRRLRDSSPTVR